MILIHIWINKVILIDSIIKQLQRGASAYKYLELHWSCTAPSNISSCDSSCRLVLERLSDKLPSGWHRSFYQENQVFSYFKPLYSDCCYHCRCDSRNFCYQLSVGPLEEAFPPACICCYKLMRNDCLWELPLTCCYKLMRSDCCCWLYLCSIKRCFCGFDFDPGQAHLGCSNHCLFGFKTEADC